MVQFEILGDPGSLGVDRVFFVQFIAELQAVKAARGV